VHVLVASGSDARYGQAAFDTADENVVMTETWVQAMISNRKASVLFADKWLRAPATTEVDSQLE
jgi:hypothetical protein